MSTRENLLEEIEAYLDRTGYSATTFGRLAVNDWKLVARLRAGRDVETGTAEKVRAYMAGNASGPKSARQAAA